MATNVVSNDPYLSPGDRRPRSTAGTANSLESLLRPLASLKLTVVLFAFAIFIVFAGTVAQVDHDVWGVVHHYFRSFFTWIDLKIFFPRDWNVPGGFPFPGGWLIGLLLIVNLLAAHGIRFKIQARGARLAAGLAVIAAGIVVTWCVIHGVDNVDGKLLWNGMKLGLAALLAVTVYSLVTLDWSRTFELGLLSVATVVEGSLLGLLLYHSDFVPDSSSMRILWQLVQGGCAGLVLLAGCALAFKKRAGVVLIHAGVALMMFNELYVGMTADEAQMRMKPGAVQNYVDDIRTVELAVVDSTDKKKDDVIVIPKQMLQSDVVIHDDRLPFDISVIKFMQNADLRTLSKGKPNLATAGIGKEMVAVPQAAGTGTDTDSKVDFTSAYVELLNKKTNDSLGTYLVSVGLDELQPVEGTNVGVALRFHRTYKSYVVQLLDTEKEDYPGTNTARSYSSDIHLIDPTNDTDRARIHIWMNNPLRFKGDTFYQSGFYQDPRTGEKQTTLTVVANRGWMIPYIGCAIVAVGLLAHFLGVLTRFLRRRASGSLEPREDSESSVPMAELAGDTRANRPWLRTAGEFFPWIAVAVLIGWGVSHAIPPRYSSDTMNLYDFGQLPVVYEGRVKPFDTMARNGLKAISDRQTWTDKDGHRHPAIEWLMDLITDPEVAANEPVFHIDDPELRDILGITAAQIEAAKTPKTDEKSAGKTVDATVSSPADKKFNGGIESRKDNRFSIADFRGGLKEFGKQWKQADSVKPAQQTPIQRQIVEFAKRLGIYRSIQDSFQPLDFPSMPSEEDANKNRDAAMATAIEIRRMLEKDMPRFHAELTERQVPLSVPPAEADGQWQPFATAIDLAFVDRVIRGSEGNPNTVSLAAIFRGYERKDAKGFNSAVAKYRDSLDASPPKLLSANQGGFFSLIAAACQKLGLIQNADKLDFEAFFNHFEPFYYGLILYLIAFILACFALLGWTVPLNRAAFWLVALTLVIHTAAMIGRIYISGRPPVTNLYSAALFIGWAGVAIGLVLELVFRLGIGTMIGALAGFMTLVIAHFLATSGDTFTVMEAVLDTQFWLATHVVCITLGYATTFIAGLLGVAYVVLGVFTPSLSPTLSSSLPPSRRTPIQRQRKAAGSLLSFVFGGFVGLAAYQTVASPYRGKTLARMIYGVLCFAIFFSFVGTVLGGLWADDSWGRFWGWDPKENGALIIVIWNALVLHARWDGMVKDRGLAVLAIGGNIAVAWSGFGVNELGAGLHSYGFTQGVALWLVRFVAIQLALILIGSMPKHLWRSFRQVSPEAIA